MIDKPIPAKIVLTLSDKKLTGEDFIELSGMLYRENLIYSEPRELRKKLNVLELTVIFRDNNSFKNWHKNTEIKEFWSAKFDKMLTGRPKTLKERDVIIEADNVCNCVCEKSEFYILQGRAFEFYNELLCGNCLENISYSKVPLDIKIEEWQTKHERVYSNWLESGLFEKEAFKELTNYKNGKLNKEGENIRKQLSEFFKIPVYINYFIEDSKNHNFCKICGQKGSSILNGHMKYCKTCNTIFGFVDR